MISISEGKLFGRYSALGHLYSYGIRSFVRMLQIADATNENERKFLPTWTFLTRCFFFGQPGHA
jgi:hypothetical protein